MKKVPFVTLEKLNEITEKYPTPFHLYDEKGIRETARKINQILSDFTSEIGGGLVDFKLEFGRYHGQLLVADEISPDSARFWDARTHEPMDLDRFRRDLGGVEQAYQDLLHRMMGE